MKQGSIGDEWCKLRFFVKLPIPIRDACLLCGAVVARSDSVERKGRRVDCSVNKAIGS